MKRILLLVLVLVVAGCSDELAGPPPVAKVNIFLGTGQPDEVTLEIGESVRLHADLEDARGAPLINRPISWRSTDPEVARVDSTGTVVARAPGAVSIIARVDAAADTIGVQVLLPANLPVVCAAGDPGVMLAVGQVHTVPANRAPLLCLRGGDAGAEYVMIPFHASTAASRLAVEVAANGVAPVQGPPDPFRGGASTWQGSDARDPGTPGGTGFHRRLREWEAARLGALARRGGDVAARRSLARLAANLQVGDTVHLNAGAASACSQLDVRVARVEAITRRAIVLGDTLNPAGGFTREEYQRIGSDFDELVWPVVTENFGEPSDIDGNARVAIFFTSAVNDLTEPNSGSYVAGFFYGRDFDPKSECEGSNATEIFYMLVPDSARGQQERAFAKQSVAEGTLSVIAHEFQHLINFSRRVANAAAVEEEVWLNEGLSHIAEELLFYSRTGLTAEQNVGIAELRASTERRTAANRYIRSNLLRYGSYLERPEVSSAISADDELATRGAAWAFLRYVADRETSGAAQPAFWRSLVESRTSGLRNLREAIGEDPLPWLQDWTVAVYTDDAGFPVSPQYVQPSWHFRDVLSNLLGTGRFPLHTVTLSSADPPAELRLEAGGAAYLRFRVAAGERGAIRTTSGGALAPSTLRLSIVRTR